MAIVYQHRRKDTLEIFYIGIGSNLDRAYHKASRNRHWKNIVKKFGYIIEILHENISWEEACKIEQDLIKLYGRKDLREGFLVNKTDGGAGATRLIHSDEYKKKLKDQGPMSNKDVVDKWKISMYNRSAQEKGDTAQRIKDSVFNSYTKQEIEERYKKMGQKMKDVKRPQTSKTMKGLKRKKSQCPHCDKIGDVSLMTRYHFENCKYKI